MARPAFDREPVLTMIIKSPRASRNLVRINQRQLAAKLGWDRSTVAAAIRDLEEDGRLERWKNSGRSGLIIRIPR